MGRTTRARRAGVALVAVALLAACTGTPDLSDPSPRPSTDEATATAVTAAIDDYLDGRAWLERVTAVVVVQDGKTIAEVYRGSQPDDHHDVQSVTKSVVGTLVGIALADGSLQGLDQTLGALLPEYAASMTPDVAATTLEHLLTMTGGFPDQLNGGGQAGADHDWVAQILASAERPPGGRFRYSNDTVHLVSAALSRATGTSVLEYARRTLFEPLGIPTSPAAEPLAVASNIPAYEAAGFAWPVDPQGVHTGHGLLRLRTRDMAALGQLFLDGGVRDGVQVVPADWVAAATRSQVEARGAADDYGYLWWVGTVGPYDTYLALGYGGQLIQVVPDPAVVVAVSSSWSLDEEGESPVGYADLQGLVREAVLPTVTDAD